MQFIVKRAGVHVITGDPWVFLGYYCTIITFSCAVCALIMFAKWLVPPDKILDVPKPLYSIVPFKNKTCDVYEKPSESSEIIGSVASRADAYHTISDWILIKNKSVAGWINCRVEAKFGE